MQANECSTLRKILFIDDDPDILALVTLSLQKIGGYEVATCTSARKGVVLAEARKPDLIMLDVMMPDVDGLELLSKIRQNKHLSHTPVVFMTARVQPADVDRYVSLGAAGVIPKPFNPLTLPEEVQELWHEHQCIRCGNMVDFVADLKQQYLANLPAKRQQIKQFARKLRSGKPADAARRDIEHLVHNLAGSGTTYGYRALSKSARVLEEMLATAPDSPKLPAVTDKLVAAIDKALAG